MLGKEFEGCLLYYIIFIYYKPVMKYPSTPWLQEESGSEYGLPPNSIDPSISWNDIYWLQSLTRLPIIIKGILTKEDADLAVRHGVQGIIVSNHGGRQLDGGPATVSGIAVICCHRHAHVSLHR